MTKPIILLDFDGVIHCYTSGWQGVDVISDPPVPGVFEWIESALNHFEVHVYSSRSIEKCGRAAMFEYIQNHAGDLASRLVYTAEKSRAFITIDDRCIRFDGNWKDPAFDPQALLKFVPWYK